MIKRFLAGIFGAILVGVLAPLLGAFLFDWPSTIGGFIWLAIFAAAAGAIFGACFPRIFGFVFEVIFDV